VRDLQLGTGICWLMRVEVVMKLAPTELKSGQYRSLHTHSLNPLTVSLTKLFILNFIEAFAQIETGD